MSDSIGFAAVQFLSFIEELQYVSQETRDEFKDKQWYPSGPVQVEILKNGRGVYSS